MLQHIERTNPESTLPSTRGQPLSVDLDQKVFKFLEDETDRCSYVSSQLLYCMYRSVICEHLGVAPEAGVYSQDKMSDPAYKCPPTFWTRGKVAKRGVYMRDTMVYALLKFEVHKHNTNTYDFSW